MRIDNFKQIRKLLHFRSEDDFFYLQILQRKKDHKQTEYKVSGTNNNSRLIKTYYISNIEYFDFIEDEVKTLCNVFNARANINLNRRSYEQTSMQCLKKVTDQIINRDYTHTYKAYEPVCGKYSNENKFKKWIVDVDDVDSDEIPEVRKTFLDYINEIKPEGDKYVATLPSKNGYHIITTPFNYQEFNRSFPNVDVHKENPTNLFIPQ
jgi:hypothetical protein